jgi:N-acetylglutamate synthase-like GNAT family acetyltransferase
MGKPPRPWREGGSAPSPSECTGAAGLLSAARLRESVRMRDTDALTVRPAVSDDVSAMRELARTAYQTYVERMGREPAPMTADYGRAVGAGQAWVAEREHRIVGLLVLVPELDHLLLENVAVAPQAQGMGVGGRLLQLAEDRARLQGLPEVRLYTNEMMNENLAYYPRHGYRETHRGTANGFARVFFTKAL